MGDEAVAAWNNLRPIIQKAVDASNGFFTERDLLDGVIQDTRQMWTADGVVIFTSVQQNLNRRLLCIDVVAGEGIETIKEGIDQICAWGRDVGCDRVVAVGREGWKRVFPDWTPRAMMMKDL